MKRAAKAIAIELASLVHDGIELALVTLTVGTMLAIVIILTDPNIWR